MKLIRLFIITTAIIFTACTNVHTENRAKRERDEARARLKMQQQYLENNPDSYQTGISVNRYYSGNPYYYHDYNYADRRYRRDYRSNYLDRQERQQREYQRNLQESSKRLPRVNRPY